MEQEAKKGLLVIYFLAFFNFLIHLITNVSGGYGLFRDELYYIACSEHLSYGYVDHPPLSIYLLKLSRTLFGDSVTGIRLLPALFSSATIILTGLLTKEMGGRSMAIFISCLAILISPIHMAVGGFYSMNSIDVFFWALSFYLILKLLNTGHGYYWVFLGIVLGLGLLNKISVVFLGTGLAGGLLITQERKWVFTRWPYLACVLCIIIFMPYILWNIQNDFAHLEFIKNASGEKYSRRNQWDFFTEIILYHHPLNLLLWIPGLLALFFYKPLQRFKIFGWIFLIAFGVLVVNRTSKGEYLSPAYCILFAAAGFFYEIILKGRKLYWLKIAYPTLMAVITIILLPTVLPILPVENFITYSKRLGIQPSSTEKKELSLLPQFYADMFGWQEKAHDVSRIFKTLSKDEKKECSILSDNYGRCGAIDFYGKGLGLPPSIGTHNNYWIWGPGNKKGNIMIILGGELKDHVENFYSVEEVGISNCRYCMPYENNVKIFLCKGIIVPLKEIWMEEKHYE